MRKDCQSGGLCWSDPVAGLPARGLGPGLRASDPGGGGVPVQRPGSAGNAPNVKPTAVAASDHGLLHDVARVPAGHVAPSPADCGHRRLRRQLRPDPGSLLARGSAAGSSTVRAVIPAGGVTSYIALQNGMTNVNARSSGLVPRQLLSGTAGVQVPQALDLVLRAVTEMPLLLGDAIYPGLNRPFSRVGVLSEFVEQVETNPPASLRHRMPQFVDECYGPAVESLMKDKPEPTFEERMPWSPDMSTPPVGNRDTGQAGGGRRLRDGAAGDFHDLSGVLPGHGTEDSPAPAQAADGAGLQQGTGGP